MLTGRDAAGAAHLLKKLDKPQTFAACHRAMQPGPAPPQRQRMLQQAQRRLGDFPGQGAEHAEDPGNRPDPYTGVGKRPYDGTVRGQTGHHCRL